MAGINDRQFTLVGNFTDNISGPLKDINNRLDDILGKLAQYTSKYTELTNVVRSFGQAAQASAADFRDQAAAVREARDAFRGYATSAGRANRANRSGGLRFLNAIESNKRKEGVSKAREEGARLVAGARAASIAEQSAARAAKDLAKAEQIASRTAAITNRIGGYGGGGGRRPPGGGGGGGGIVRDVVSANLITDAIVKGFQVGTSLFQNAFQKAGQAFGERVGDQLQDIGAAGGIYSAAQFGGATKLVKTLQDAENLQDKLNKEVALRAAALPGTTHDFVRNARLLVDTTAKIMADDQEKFIQGMRKLTGNMALNAQGAFVQFNADFAEATTLLEQLTGSSRSVVPTTQIVEDILNADKLNVKALRTRYIAIKRGSTLEAALTRNEGKINETRAKSFERSLLLLKALREAVPPKLIARMNVSIKGVVENFRSFLFDPDVGLLGLSRDLGFEIQEYNRGTGKLIKDSKESAQFFRILADVIGNLGAILGSILPVAVGLFSPFKKAAEILLDLRRYSFEAFEDLQEYYAYYTAQAKKFGLDPKAFQANTKAGLSVLSDILYGYKLIGKAEYEDVTRQLESNGSAQEISETVRAVGSQLIQKILDSPFFASVLETLGASFAKLLEGFAVIGETLLGLGTGGKEAKGFAKGFQDAGGFDAISRLIIVISEAVVKAILLIADLLVKALFKAITSGNLLAAAGIGAVGAGLISPVAGLLGGLGGGGGGGGGIFGPTKATKQLRGKLGTGAKLLKQIATESLPHALSFHPGVQKVGKAVAPVARGARAVGKFVPGGAVLGGVASLATSLATGEKFGTAAAGAIGSVLLATAGSFLGPAGTIIGGLAGDYLGKEVAKWFDPAGAQQREAARIQEEAAKIQQEVAKKTEAPGASKLGGLFSLGEKLGGGTGIKEFARKQLEYGAIDKQTYEHLNSLGGHLTEINSLNKELEKANEGAKNAKLQNTGDEKKFLTKAEQIRQKLKTAQERATTQWEQAGSDARVQILRSAGVVAGAMDDAARIIKLRALADRGQVDPESEKLLSDYAAQLGRSGLSTNQISSVVEGARNEIIKASRTGDINVLNKAQQTIKEDTEEIESGDGGGARYKGQLGAAISTELRNKPPGSDLVVANTSETIIPAAGGHGVGALIDTFRSGLNSLAVLFKQTKDNQDKNLNNINNTLKANQLQTNLRLQKIETKFSSPGGPLGSSIGGAGVFGSIASRYGLTMTSGYRPGDPGYHGINRARDYSNSTGPTPQMMAFAQFLATNYGRNLKELIYTPLGYSIKNGQRVSPIARGSHYNHVHVAYGLGYPTALSSLEGARAFEKAVTPGSVKIASVTGRSDEGFGSTTTVTNYFTINQTPGQSSEEIASIVVEKIQNAVDSLGNSYYA